MITLNAVARDVKVNPKLIRKGGSIPAVFYGKGQQTTPISVSKKEFMKVLSEAGETSLITLVTPAGKLDALVHDVALDPVIGDPIHVDFYITSKDQKIQVAIPLEFTGVSPAEKLGGVVMKVIHEIVIEALPGKLPQHLTVDLSKLAELGSHITVADVALPEGARALVSQTEVVALVAVPHSEEDSQVVAPDLSSIEVQKKGKKEEEEAAA